MENSQLLEHIGKTKTQKLQDEITKEYFEIFEKKFPSYSENHKMNSLVTVTKEKEIRSIGMSCINDLINDNWGKMLSSLIAGDEFIAPPNVDIGGTTNNALFVYRTSGSFNMTDTAGAVGSNIAIGQGLTPAARTDFDIETDFAIGPESILNPTGNGGWSSVLGQVQIPWQIISLGSGTITETGLFGQWGTLSPVEIQQYLLSHDNISPGVAFVGGQSVNVDYSMVFN